MVRPDRLGARPGKPCQADLTGQLAFGSLGGGGGGGGVGISARNLQSICMVVSDLVSGKKVRYYTKAYVTHAQNIRDTRACARVWQRGGSS